MKTYLRILLAALLLFSITACLPPASDQQPASNDQNPEDPTPEILADCFRSFNLSAWVDLNEDNVWDPSEPALDGVEFSITGFFVAALSEHPCLSDQDGRCTLATWAPGECLPGDFTITALPPDAYQPTTPSPLAISLTTTDFASEAGFGFRAIMNE